MSYTSESKLPRSINLALAHLIEVIELLGFKRLRNNLNIPDQIGSYFWYDQSDFRSWSGVELQVYKKKHEITVDTRSTVSRSYWDLTHQNNVLKIIRGLFGGHFITDAGRNRYWRPDSPPPSPTSSGCYLARWRFHNALGKAHVYLMTRNLEGNVAREKPSGFQFMDEMNPRLLSNNLLVPYVLAVWEEYFRATFAAVLKYSKERSGVLKKAKLSHTQLEEIAIRAEPVERTIADCFSFQRPSLIASNFKLLDAGLDLGAAMRKPYKRRKISLYDSIEAIVERRNDFVHAGTMDLVLYDKQLSTELSDIVEAVDRCYAAVGKHSGFIPIRDY